jgi:hypothetical protein
MTRSRAHTQILKTDQTSLRSMLLEALALHTSSRRLPHDVVVGPNNLTLFSPSNLNDGCVSEEINTGLHSTQALLSGLGVCEQFVKAALGQRADHCTNESMTDVAGLIDADRKDSMSKLDGTSDENPDSAGHRKCTYQAEVDDMDVVGQMDCDWAVRSATQFLLASGNIGQGDVESASLAETSGVVSNPEPFNAKKLISDVDAPHDEDMECCLSELAIDTVAIDAGTMDRFLCHVGGFDYEEPGFSCRISFCRCLGDACRNATTPPPTAFERRMCERRMAGIMLSLIDEARTKEAERRRSSAAKHTLIDAEDAAWSDACATALATSSARTAAVARASASVAAALRSSVKRALPSSGNDDCGGGKRGRPCAVLGGATCASQPHLPPDSQPHPPPQLPIKAI